MNDIVVMTDFGSTEGSRAHLTRAVQVLTARAPVAIDARRFYDGGDGTVRWIGSTPILEIPIDGVHAEPAVLILYEIPPADRPRLALFQETIGRDTVACLGIDASAWHVATDKQYMIDRFRTAGIPQMESIVLQQPSASAAEEAFERLDCDVWTRPAVGMGGSDVFHVTDGKQLRSVVARYAASGQKFVLTRDAGNFDVRGRRHQYRVVVLGDRVLRVCEHVQANPDLPCNESRGARSILRPRHALTTALEDLAIAATRALGLPFGGVDLAVENGGVVFEVNVHPVLTGDQGFETVAIPYVQAHLAESASAGR
ncbi:ATP-grasp domain-containing protein [Nocardia aurantiaca]|uniref:Alpha-L-glutamate ligase n=1 Tax=Nocardia aurantiaca TaxID=2675850 RepID=A0A6I3L6F5_9NOCA|nr:alpha-L-glutamate ligase [Nocardia aurantiaca]MTE16254.1 alpha-L-glutamate ligase [Nocardia aurantiaca]